MVDRLAPEVSVVPEEDIEHIVGVPRWFQEHIGRWRPDSGSFYILHSQECLDSTPDLRDCAFSAAMAVQGWDVAFMREYLGRPCVLEINRGIAPAFPINEWPYLPQR